MRRIFAVLPRLVLLGLNVLALAAATPLATLVWAAPPGGVAAHEMRGLDGATIRLEAPAGGVTVVVFYSSECPISNAYSVTLNALREEFPASALKLIGVCVDPDLPDEQVARHAKEFGLKYPVARDRAGALAVRLGAKVTPEAFVIDAAGQVLYHGRIDDQFAARLKRNANPRSNELHDAVSAALDGRAVEHAYVAAVGCPLPEPPKPAAAATFSRDVASILQKHCQECHRPGQVGPFSLMTFEQARKRAEDIATVVSDRKMPPWKPVPGFGPKFKNVRSLSESEIASLTAWAAAGALEGNPADMPVPAQFSDEWALGTPDLVLEPAEDFDVPATGNDIYRCFVIPTDLPKDMEISAIEYQPGNRRVVHHVLCYVDTSGEARKKDDADEG